MLKKIIISPPFGNYIEREWATSIKGTYTLKRRPGAIIRALLTVRKVKNGWVNKIGLRNPGIKSITHYKPNHIYSIAAVNSSLEWDTLYKTLPDNIIVELNAGCPNIDINRGIPNIVFEKYCEKFTTILKISPTPAGLMIAYRAYDVGVRYFHLSNTIPVDRGGESGTKLKIANLTLIGMMRERYGNDVKIIAGGGIYSPRDVDHYISKGVDYFSLATIWFTPWKVKHVRDHILNLT